MEKEIFYLILYLDDTLIDKIRIADQFISSELRYSLSKLTI